VPLLWHAAMALSAARSDGVNCSCIVQEGTGNVLDAFDLLQGEGLCAVDLHPLNPCAILDWGRLVGSMLGRDWFGVLVLREGFVDVPRHMAMTCPSV
jgi:hypothetical protein